ncbi:cell wall-active antibiotics response protein LiaF [Bacillus sp. AK031]
MRHSGGKQWFFSAILLFTGIILLLINIGVISLEIKQLFVISIPFLIALEGLKWVINSIRWKRTGKFTVGLFLFIFGILLILDVFDFISFSYGDWLKLWPVILIGIAFMVIWKKNKIKFSVSSDYPFEKENSGNREADEQHKADKHEKQRTKVNRGLIIGDVKFNQPNWPLESMRLYNVIGDYYFDLSKAYIPEGETPIHLKGWIGDVKMLIPEDIPVDIKVEGNVGDIKVFDQKSSDIKPSLHYRSDDYEEAEKKISIVIEFKIGSVRINRV